MKKLIIMLVIGIMFSVNVYAEEVIETPVVEETPIVETTPEIVPEVLVCSEDNHQVLNETSDSCICIDGYKMNDDKECIKKSSGSRVIGYNPNFNYEEVFGKKEVKVEVTPVVKFVFTSFMKIGSTGSEVVELQKVLGITADGSFGPITLKAVKDYQTSKGLVSDGIVGPKTLAELNK